MTARKPRACWPSWKEPIRCGIRDQPLGTVALSSIRHPVSSIVTLAQPMIATMPWTVDDILSATGGELAAGERHRSFASISIDSRTIRADDAFVAIRGEVHDGHRFSKMS